MESDLHRFYNIDLADLYRGELSLRKVSVLIANLPVGSATWAIQNDIPFGWTLTDVLLTDLFHAFTGNPHPARPSLGKKAEGVRAKRIASRLLEQKARLASN